MVRVVFAFVLAICLFVGSAPRAQTRDADIARQSRALLEELTTSDGPGAVFLVLRGDQVIFREARGMADIELGVALDPDQTFRIASITKTFTAATVVRLAQEGRLSLDDSLSRWLPNFPRADTITLRQLLNHTAGVSDVVVSPTPGFSRRDLTTADIVGEITRRPSEFAPGSRQSYSNANYILLGAVIEAVTRKSWPEVVQETLLRPLSLDHTLYGADGPIVRGRVSGYARTTPDGPFVNARYINASGPAAAGALLSTVDDLGLWVRALGQGRAAGAQGWREMTTAPALPEGQIANYGLGLYLWRVRDRPMAGHTGQINGFASIAAYLPDDDITVVALANSENFDARTAGRRLAAIALGRPYAAPPSRPATVRELADLPGVYGVDPAEARTLIAQDGQLYSQRPGRSPSLLQIGADGHLRFVPDELSYLEAVRDASGVVTALDYIPDGDGAPRRLPRQP